jgi:hypothetical protein
MALSNTQIEALGLELYTALRECRTLTPFTDRTFGIEKSGIEITDSYHISKHMVQLRLENARCLSARFWFSHRCDGVQQ